MDPAMNDSSLHRFAVVPLLCLMMVAGASAQDLPELSDLDGLLGTAREWIEQNLDERIARALDGLEEGSPEKTREALREIQREFGGEYVMDVARIRHLAEVILPLLDEFEETADYAPWLRTRLDYLDIADELVVLPPPTRAPGSVAVDGSTSTNGIAGSNRPATNAPAKRMDRVNPAAEVQRRVWQRRISTRAPLPAGDAFAERLKPLFTGAGIPAELVWLAEVESSFNPEATSPAGAVGLFQLMPATARSLGLSIAGPDERRHPAKSARAAATYLGQLHRRFGDWRLALAAYNAGQGRVQRALDRFKAKTFEEISPHLPAETQFYVPKFEAVLKRRESMRIEDLAPWKP